MEKRKYLYYHLNEIDNNKNNLIYNYITENVDGLIENNNGLLLNLSILDDIHIDKIYDLYNLKGNKINYDQSDFKYLTPTKNQSSTKTHKIYKKYDMNNLEKKILSYS